MVEVINALKDTPIPTIVVVGGIALLLLSVAGNIGGKIKVSRGRQKWAAITGSVLVLLGTALYLVPRPDSDGPSATATPTSSPTHAPPATSVSTAEASAAPTPCGLPVNSQLATAWDRDELGCPAEPAKREVPLVQESFERGHMLWRGDLGYIYVLYDDVATWQKFKDTWEEGQAEYTCPESAPSETPPTPCRGFGKVWCLQSGVKDRIGNAEERERGYTGIIQVFQSGLMVTSSENGVYILRDDSSWEGL